MKPKIGLALGSGGARGLAHLGVLKALEEEHIAIDYIAGSSMGAVVGAMYAQNPDINAVTQKFVQFLNSEDYKTLGLKFLLPSNDQPPSFLSHFAQVIAKRIIVNIAQSRTGIIKTERLTSAIVSLVDDGDIRDTKIPFAAVATDLNSGQTTVFTEGNIREAVVYSASIPGFIAPHNFDGKLLTDGAVTAPVPVFEVRQLGANFIIAVNVGINTVKPLDNPNIIDILTRSDTLRGIVQAELQMQHADIQIHPDVKDAHWSEFDQYEEFMQAGWEATHAQMPLIKRKLQKSAGFFNRVFTLIIRR